MLQDIDYQAYLDRLPSRDEGSVIALLSGEMVSVWGDRYLLSASPGAHLLRFKDSGYEYLFDLASEGVAQVDSATPADRVVVSFGRSYAQTERRDSSRMSGFIGRSSVLGENTDKGHFMSHGTGGGLDVNLYPQRRDFNQRRRSNPRSYVYYDMERYTREHPGTFYFNRPIYTDLSWHPAIIEFGIVRADGNLWIEQFDNT